MDNQWEGLNDLIRVQRLRRVRRFLCASLALLLIASMLYPANSIAAAKQQDVIIFEEDGLWVMRQPWPVPSAWCQNGGASPAHKVYDIYAYYDVPHDRRMERLGSSYESFVSEKVVSGIRQLCGADTSVTDISLALYRMREEVQPSGLVEDLTNSRTQPWDFVRFTVEDDNVKITGYQAKDAMFHLSHAEVVALDPRNEKAKQENPASKRITDYTLYEGDRFRMTSVFDQSGTAWCEHVYVPILVVHEGSVQALDKLMAPDYESFLETHIVPKIKSICPSFPEANQHFGQSIRLEFLLAGEARAASSMGFVVDTTGAVKWREGRQTKRQIALAAAQHAEQAKVAAAAQREKERIAEIARQERLARRADAATDPGYDFIEVECTQIITGYMHTNTLVPYVKMTSTLNAEATQKRVDEVADCYESLATILQLSNPYASHIEFEVFDNAGRAFIQNEVAITPRMKTEPLHRPETLAMYVGTWKSVWYEMDLRWHWQESEFSGVITALTPDGHKSGLVVGDKVLTARIHPVVLVKEDMASVSILATLKLTPDSFVVDGGISLQFERGDFLVFTEASRGEQMQMTFDKVEHR